MYVNQDGVQFNAPAVFDQLIAKKEMPVTIGVFVMHGRVKAANGPGARPLQPQLRVRRPGRQLRAVPARRTAARGREAEATSDGRAIRLSKNGNDRCIAGAQQRRDLRLHGGLGTARCVHAACSAPSAPIVGLRGGNVYPTLIRKYEPKPIRIFLQDGSNDLNIYGGDWWMANQEMERSARLRRLRSEPRLGRRRPQRQARHEHLSRRDAVALEGLAEARHEGRGLQGAA